MATGDLHDDSKILESGPSRRTSAPRGADLEIGHALKSAYALLLTRIRRATLRDPVPATGRPAVVAVSKVARSPSSRPSRLWACHMEYVDENSARPAPSATTPGLIAFRLIVEGRIKPKSRIPPSGRSRFEISPRQDLQQFARSWMTGRPGTPSAYGDPPSSNRGPPRHKRPRIRMRAGILPITAGFPATRSTPDAPPRSHCDCV